MQRLFLLVAALATQIAVARADEVLDSIDAARAAYEAGDIEETLGELANAQQLVREMKATGLASFLPPAPEGWERVINTEMGAAMAMVGGGVGSEATYSRGNDRFSVMLMADNAMVQGFAGLLGGGVGLTAGKQVPVGAETFMEQNGELTGLVDGRILVQAKGAPLEVMLPILEKIDFAGMAGFGK